MTANRNSVNVRGNPSSANPRGSTDKSSAFVWENFINKVTFNWKPLLIGLGIVILIVLTASFIIYNHKVSHGKAYHTLQSCLPLNFDNIMDQSEKIKLYDLKRGKLESLITDEAESAPAIEARFYLATLDFSMGKYTEAATQYTEFYTKYPDYKPFSDRAYMGEANALFAQKKFEQAKNKYQFISEDQRFKNDSSALSYKAQFQWAVCSLLTDKVEEGQKQLNNILAAPTSATLKERVQSLLGILKIIPLDELKNRLVSAGNSPMLPELEESAETMDEASPPSTIK